MMSLILLIWTAVLFAQNSSADIIVTQSQRIQTALVGQSVSLKCTTSTSISQYLMWYHQKPEQAPRLLIYDAVNRFTGIPERFRGSGSGADFTLTISDVQDEDSGYYYCQQRQSLPFTQC
uniref:Ig-like domain-containing protein n=1 Tax=Erpetoichthys calabaricus TaxID=27687 RepID=A0A8C4RMA5_ERPCA